MKCPVVARKELKILRNFQAKKIGVHVMHCSNDDRQNFERIFSFNQPDKCYNFYVESPKNNDFTENCPILDLDDFYECKDDLVGGVGNNDQETGDTFFFIPYGLINNYAGLLVVVLVALFAYYLIINRLKKLLFSQATCEKNGKRRKNSCPRKSIVGNENFENYNRDDKNCLIRESQLSSLYCSLDEQNKDKKLQSGNEYESRKVMDDGRLLPEGIEHSEREESNLDEPYIGKKKEQLSLDDVPVYGTPDHLEELFSQKDCDVGLNFNQKDDLYSSGVTAPKNSLIEFPDDGQVIAWSIDRKTSDLRTKISGIADDERFEISEIRILPVNVVKERNSDEKSQEQSIEYSREFKNQRSRDQHVDNVRQSGFSHDLTDVQNFGMTEQKSAEIDRYSSNDSAAKIYIEVINDQPFPDDNDNRHKGDNIISLLPADNDQITTDSGLNRSSDGQNKSNPLHEVGDRNFDQLSSDRVINEQRKGSPSCEIVENTVSDRKTEIISSLDFTADNLLGKGREPETPDFESENDPSLLRMEELHPVITEKETNEEIGKTYVDSTKMIELNFDVTVTTSQKIMPKKLEDEDRIVLENREFTNLYANTQVFVEFFNKFNGSISVESKVQSIIQFESLEATYPTNGNVVSLSFNMKHDERTADQLHENNIDRENQLIDQVLPDISTFNVDNCENVCLNCEVFAKYGSSIFDQRTVLCTIFHDKQESSADFFAVAKPWPVEQPVEKLGNERTAKNGDFSSTPTGSLTSKILPRKSYDISVNLHNKFGDNGCTVEIVLLKHLGENTGAAYIEEEEGRLISLGTKVKLERNVDSRSQAPKKKNLEILSSETECIQNKNYDIVQEAEIRIIRDDENLMNQRQEAISSDYDYDSAEFADNTTAPEIDTFLEIDTDNMPQDQDVYDENANLPDYFVEDGEESSDLNVPEHDVLEKSGDLSSIEGDVEVKATVLLKKSRAILENQEECDIVLSQSEKDSIEMLNVNSVLGLFNTKKCDDVIHRVDTLEAVADIMRRAGLESSNLIFGIDYTASNKYQGEICFDGKSLHSIEPGVLNPYQQVISILGKTLAHFVSEEGYLTAYGFGDEKTKDHSTFPLGDKPFCSSFEEILHIYNTVTPTVKLGGPTNFAPLIYGAMELCKKLKEYHILVIVADGQVTNERATRRAIVEACRFPLSIIVVGVGDGPWDMMKVFDDMLPRRPWDNFHFIEFNEIVEHYSRDGNFETAFAVQSLLEIPDQYKIIKDLGMLDLDERYE
uniref:VWFA domain-containing protein n=1 Tax=Romanomermis culicivorax TaxID=13658 RepID=A0A915J236_ROMCU